ncbi:glycerophosphodiester phosphodiesterase [Thalassotalea aquiviva]|uniref:glycerophosphodiester phosphodiesterase n=1 Tax=Thalassotalea aquiviva TaxID=3242415 RepID=UPI003529F67D
MNFRFTDKNKKGFISSCLLIILLPFFLSLFIDLVFKYKLSNSSFFYNSCHKVWAHRGYHKEFEQNSIKAVKKAIELNAKGIEVDVFFDEVLNDYIISHDYPYNLKYGKLLTLKELFNSVNNDVYFWLDFKNLKYLDEANINSAVSRFLQLTKEHHLKDRVLIESQSANHLKAFSLEGFNTSYWITFNERDGKLNFLIEIYKLKIKYILEYFSAVSMGYQNYSPILKDSLNSLPILLFTVNEKNILKEFLRNEYVKVTLSDENFYTAQYCH